MSETDFKGLIGPVARKLFDDPTTDKPNELRFGTKGSLRIDLEKDVWKDHETGEKGGVLGLIIYAQAADTNAEAYGWMEQQGIVKGNGKANGTNRSAFPPRSETLVAQYEYTDEFGTPTIATWRYEPRRFERYSWNGERWQRGGTSGLLTHPYKLLGILWSQDRGMTIYICEGEKDVDRLTKLRLIATTNIGGAGSWKPEINKWFEGRNVVILPDNDDAGRKHGQDVAKQLSGIASSIRIVELPGLPDKGDVSNWLDQNGDDREALLRIVDNPPSPLGIWNAGIDDWVIPPRGWLLANVFCRGFVSSLLADGGVGKTAVRIAQLLSMACGRSLIGEFVFERCRVLVLSFEDGRDELRRRVLAAMKYHNVSNADIDGYLFLGALSRKDGKLMVLDRKGNAIEGTLGGTLRQEIVRLKIDMVSMDPLVKTHAVSENSNDNMDAVIQLLADMAVDLNIGVDTPHHTSKGTAEPGNAGRGRGASSVKDGARLVDTLAPMTSDEARLFDISDADRVKFIRLDNGKVNIIPASAKARWFELKSVSLGNETDKYPAGDSVQTVEKWFPPEVWEDTNSDVLNRILTDIDAGLADGERYTDAPRAGFREAWRPVKKAIPDKPEGQCRAMIKEWVKTGLLEVREYQNRDSKTRNGLYVIDTKRPGTKL